MIIVRRSIPGAEFMDIFCMGCHRCILPGQNYIAVTSDDPLMNYHVACYTEN